MSKTIFALVVALAFVAGSITTTNFAEAKNNKSLADSFFDIFTERFGNTPGAVNSFFDIFTELSTDSFFDITYKGVIPSCPTDQKPVILNGRWQCASPFPDSFFDIFYDLRQQSIQDQQCPVDQYMTGIAKGIVTCKALLGISGRPN